MCGGASLHSLWVPPLKGTESEQGGRDWTNTWERTHRSEAITWRFYPRPRVWNHQRAGWASIPIEASQIIEPLD